MSDERKITVKGNEYKLSDLTAGQIAIVQQLNHCASKIRELELDLGQAKMAYDGFIDILEKALGHPVQGSDDSIKKSA